MNHPGLQQLTAGAALDDLDPVERERLDRHIATCRDCSALALELDEVMADLALIAPEVEPPASLRTDLFAAIRGEGRAAVPELRALHATRPRAVAGATSATGGPRTRRLPAIVGLAAAAVFGFVAVGLGLRAGSLDRELAAVRGEQAAERAALGVAADPDHRTAALTAPAGPSGTVVWLPGRAADAWLVAELPPTPPGRVYQLWHADASGVHPLGTFEHDGQGPLVAAFGVDLASSDAAMLTIEPAGGARAEPGPQVLFGDL